MKRAAFLLLLSACSPSFTTLLRVPDLRDEVDHFQSGQAQSISLARQAGVELGCDAVAIQRKATSDVFRAVGCSKQRIYLRKIVVTDTTYGTNSAVYHETLTWHEIGSLSPEAVIDRDQPVLSALVRLNAQGSKDLQCPRAEVAPELQSLGHGVYAPIAEGCGRRASYAPGDMNLFRLTSKVDAPDAPSGFVTWDGSHP